MQLLLPVMEYRKAMGDNNDNDDSDDDDDDSYLSTFLQCKTGTIHNSQVVVEPTTTLSVAIQKIVKEDVHRAWIVVMNFTVHGGEQDERIMFTI